MELTIVNRAAAPRDATPSFTLRAGTTTIGRGAEADWRLPDPTRLMSSVHCRIDVEDGRVAVTDTSRNGTTLDGLPVDADTPLTPGGVLGVGPYRIALSGGGGRAVASPGGGGVADTDDLRSLLLALQSALSAMAPGLSELDVEPPPFGPDTVEGVIARDPGSIERVEAHLAALADHEHALVPAMQTALFRLLNDLSPYPIEDRVGGINADAKRWRAFRNEWERLATASENGMLDAFMGYLREAYAEQRDELGGGVRGTDGTP